MENPSVKRSQPFFVVSRGKTVTGTMFEVSWDVNKNRVDRRILWNVSVILRAYIKTLPAEVVMRSVSLLGSVE